jgi:uncharacterized protein (DUF1697 family)
VSRTVPEGPLRTYVALLRAINVGGHTVKMDRLRELFVPLPVVNVRTFIASGNVIFESAEAPGVLEPMIEARLRASLGYEVVTFLRSQEEMAGIAARKPFAESALDGASVYVIFHKERLTRAAANGVVALRTDLDDLQVHGREVYWLRRSVKARIGEPGPPLDRVVSQPATTRNITTVRKLAAKYCP